MEQMMLGDDFLPDLDNLPDLDKKATLRAVEAALEKYRLCKYLTFEEREPAITQSYDERFHGPTNVISDKTANIAIHNVDTREACMRYCQIVENAVKRLPRMERFLIENRYMCLDAQYITDYHVYCHVFDPPISPVRYARIRWRAIYKLALALRLVVVKKGGDAT